MLFLTVVVTCAWACVDRSAQADRKDAGVVTNAAAPPGWTRVTIAGKFSIALPPNLTARPQTGLDSLAGEFTSPGIELRYDYGKFADRLSYATKPEYHEESLEVSGRPARLVTFTDPDPASDRPYVAAIHFADLKDGDRLTLYVRARTPADIATAKEIFQSIEFL